jgi:DegV family protein with EDD domain
LNIQIITDSTSDITQDAAEKLGIRVVPIYIRFGDKVYRDGVDMDSDTFYEKLVISPVQPATSQPTPEDFESVFREYCKKTDGIISIHVSSRISGTYNSAMIAKKMLASNCPIEVIDSRFNSGGLALITMAAARLARAGESFPVILEETRESINQIHMFGVFNTMKYLAKSGRVNRAIVAAAEFLNVKPLLTFRDGDVIRAGLVRSISRGMERICRFVEEKGNIMEMVIVHSAIPEQAEKLKRQLGQFFPLEKINIMKLGSGLGVHGGPGVLLAAVRVGQGEK